MNLVKLVKATYSEEGEEAFLRAKAIYFKNLGLLSLLDSAYLSLFKRKINF
jgi:hypothetical protein